MVCNLESSICPVHITRSQLVLPRRNVIRPAPPENCESLWIRVNRICDRYMPQLLETGLGPEIWWMSRGNDQK
jgi:hypothetical protein